VVDADSGAVVVIGGTRGLGLEVARAYAERGRTVVLSGRDAGQAQAVAKELGGSASGIGLDLTRVEEIPGRLDGIGPVAHLVLAAIDRDENTVRDYDVSRAMKLLTMKLAGSTEVLHTLLDRMGDDSSVLIFGGQARHRPYPGSLTVTTVNGGVEAMVRTLAVELAPIRCNGLHPGIVTDSPQWSGNEAMIERTRARTPGGRTVTMADVVGAAAFLLENKAMTGANLAVDAGWLLT
jgi:NAD(P)-dependent dehydrogenase (short-subunit alcohol dehydrogenase family)